jgi:hypothetical protein
VRDNRVGEWRVAGVQLLYMAFGFVIVAAPFWLFEIRHDWVNTRAFFTYLLNKQNEVTEGLSYFGRLRQNSQLITSGIVGSEAIAMGAVPRWVTFVGGLLLFGYPLWVKRAKKFRVAPAILWYYLVGTLLIVSVLKERVHAHYVSHLFPVIALMFGVLVARSRALVKIGTMIFLGALLFWSWPTLHYNLAEKSSIQVLRAQEISSYIVGHAAGRPYNVVNTQGSTTTTIQYYLALSDNPPSNTLQPLIFDVCEGGPCPLDDETTSLLFLTGPTHPSIDLYLGHPQYNEFSQSRRIIKNERVSYDTYVAIIELTEK